MCLDVIRIVAVFLVIINHVSAEAVLNPATGIPAHFGWWGAAFWDLVVGADVSLFVMISGALFLSKPQLPIRTIWTKYIPRLLFVYVVWVLIYGLFFRADWEINSLKDFLTAIANGGCGHLWFMPMLMVVYACLPILRKIKTDKKLLTYSIILTAGLLGYNFIAGALGYIPWHQSEIIALTQRLPLVSIAYTVIIYCGYALLGYYLYKYNPSKAFRRNIYILTPILLLIAMAMSGILTAQLGSFTYLSGGKYLPTMLEAIAIFLLFKHSVYIKAIDGYRSGKLIQYLSTCTLGIYLIHMLVLQKIIFLPIWFNNLFNRWSWIFIPLIAGLIFTISLIITIALKKVPFIKKIVD